jgi:hypothetical protein
VINASGRFQVIDEEEKSLNEDEFNPFMLKAGPSKSMVAKTKEQRLRNTFFKIFFIGL